MQISELNHSNFVFNISIADQSEYDDIFVMYDDISQEMKIIKEWYYKYDREEKIFSILQNRKKLWLYVAIQKDMAKVKKNNHWCKYIPIEVFKFVYGDKKE